ncbi:MAG: Gfo/Idh/MocA family oxidoreductase, partial [Candidatus Omnitrophota bacterium]
MSKVNVGLIGFGTIGAGVAEALIKRKSYLKRKVGFEIDLKKICDKDLSSNRGVTVSKKLFTRNVDDILTDPDIDIVVELIGGIHPAKEIVKKALANGKYVVTANKALLCEEGRELFECANIHKRCIRFEGAVGGGIPIIKSLKEGLVANNIQAIYGIVN